MHPRVTRHSYPRKPLVVAMLSAALLLQAGVVHPLTSAGQASAAEAARSYAIAAGPLGAVLSRFASDAGVVLSFDADLTQGKRSQGLQGTYSVEQGFARLLAGSEPASDGREQWQLRAAAALDGRRARTGRDQHQCHGAGGYH